MAPEPQRHPSETSTPRQRAFLIFFPPGLTRPPAIAPTLSRAARIVGFSNSAVQPRAVLDWACLSGNARREKRFLVAALNGGPIHSVNCSSGPGAPVEFGSWVNVRSEAEAQTDTLPNHLRKSEIRVIRLPARRIVASISERGRTREGGQDFFIFFAVTH